MIWESHPWKRALRADVHRLDRLRDHRNSESKLASIERTLFTAGFSIRKLMEADKLTDRTAALRLKALKYPRLSEKVPDRMNWHRLDEFYSFDSAEPEEIPLRRVCNLLVHSFAFSIMDEDDGSAMAGILVNTDRDRAKCVHQLMYEELRLAFLRVADDHVVASRWQRKPNGQFVIQNFGAEDAPSFEGFDQ